MNTLEPAQYLRMHRMDRKSRLGCPECKTVFIADEGVCFPVSYMGQGKECFGMLAFCSTVCLLKWISPKDMGQA
jgi:hypothetical protein